MKVGKVKAALRYPVKSMQGELLQVLSVKEYGVVGDRIYAWEKEDKPGDYLTIPEAIYLLDYDIHMDDKERCTLEIDGETYSLVDKGTTDRISQKRVNRVKLVKINLEMESPAYWDSPLLLTSTASLKELERLCGRDDLDMLRFRPNVIMNLDEQIPFQEESWVGKEIKINDVVLKVVKGCKRCAYVNVNTATKEVDTNVLKTILKENQQIFGVYTTVVQSGTIRNGDNIDINE